MVLILTRNSIPAKCPYFLFYTRYHLLPASQPHVQPKHCSKTIEQYSHVPSFLGFTSGHHEILPTKAFLQKTGGKAENHPWVSRTLVVPTQVATVAALAAAFVVTSSAFVAASGMQGRVANHCSLRALNATYPNFD